MAAGAIVGMMAQDEEAFLQKQLEDKIQNRPGYKIHQEAFTNQNIARQQAYGRDAGIQNQEDNIEQASADAAYNAANYSNSSSALQATIAAINAGKITSMRDLASQEAAINRQGKSQLIGVNSQMLDEKDKAWNYNINMPYQMRIAALRDKIKFQQELQMAGLSYEAQTTSSMLGGMTSMGG